MYKDGKPSGKLKSGDLVEQLAQEVEARAAKQAADRSAKGESKS